jgi:hypothetical protein
MSISIRGYSTATSVANFEARSLAQRRFCALLLMGSQKTGVGVGYPRKMVSWSGSTSSPSFAADCQIKFIKRE